MKTSLILVIVFFASLSQGCEFQFPEAFVMKKKLAHLDSLLLNPFLKLSGKSMDEEMLKIHLMDILENLVQDRPGESFGKILALFEREVSHAIEILFLDQYPYETYHLLRWLLKQDLIPKEQWPEIESAYFTLFKSSRVEFESALYISSWTEEYNDYWERMKLSEKIRMGPKVDLSKRLLKISSRPFWIQEVYPIFEIGEKKGVTVMGWLRLVKEARRGLLSHSEAGGGV